MPTEEEIKKILENELTKLGAISGAVGGSIINNSAVSGAISGGIGARLGAKMISVQNFQQTVELKLSNAEIINLLTSKFDNKPPELLQNGSQMFKKVTHSGFLNMNPTVIIAIVTNSSVLIVGAAKEGLIKQQSAKKAVTSLVSSLKQT